jgi:hypothetical protein
VIPDGAAGCVGRSIRGRMPARRRDDRVPARGGRSARRTPAGQRTGAGFDQLAQLALCEVRIPRHHDEVVKEGRRPPSRPALRRIRDCRPLGTTATIRRVRRAIFHSTADEVSRAEHVVETEFAGPWPVAQSPARWPSRHSEQRPQEGIQKPHVLLDAIATTTAPRP